jgi:hypothetical protein
VVGGQLATELARRVATSNNARLYGELTETSGRAISCMLAHERRPLAAIQYANPLTKRPSRTTTWPDLADRLRNLAHLIDDLLDVSDHRDKIQFKEVIDGNILLERP